MYACSHCESMFRTKPYTRSYKQVNGIYTRVELPFTCPFCKKDTAATDIRKNIKVSIVEKLSLISFNKNNEELTQFKKELDFLDHLNDIDKLRFLTSFNDYNVSYWNIRNNTWATVKREEVLFMLYFKIKLPCECKIVHDPIWRLSFPIASILNNFEEPWKKLYNGIFNEEKEEKEEKEEEEETTMVDILED